jgi:RND family efflux transporter MFP subunit
MMFIRSRTARSAALLALLAVASGGAWGQSTARSSAGAGGAATNANGDMVVIGTTEPAAKVEIPSSIRGILAEVAVQEGQPIRKGDRLAKLDDAVQTEQVNFARIEAEQTSEVESLKNQIAFADDEVDRLKKIGGAELRQKVLAATQARLALKVYEDKQRQKQIELRKQEILLKQMTLTSSVDGFVYRVHKQVGEMTDEGPVITVVQTNKLSAVFYLQKSLFGKVGVGNHVSLEFEGGLKREGVVVTVDPVIEAGLFRVKLDVDNSDARIPAGLSATWTWPKKAS